MRDIQHALIDAQLWWKHLATQDISRRFELTSVHRPDEIDPFAWEHAQLSFVPSTIRERRQLLDKNGITEKDGGKHEPGRLLIFDHESTMNDGVALRETAGLLDVHNCPPSGFWLGFVPRINAREESLGHKQFLISWIPYELEALMTREISVIAKGCLDWVDSSGMKGSILSKKLLKILHD